MEQKLVTILTPSYNRSKNLIDLYESLKQQSSFNFEWLIVDDGSTDDTSQVVDDICIRFNPFPIRYMKKENGGKHTALNVGVQNIETSLTFIVDSDDLLSIDAIETICKDYQWIKNYNLCGIGYLRGYIKEDTHIGDFYPQDYGIDSFINIRYNQNISGDKAEVWVTKYLKDNPFPVFEGEKFISESVVWIKLALQRKMLFVNKIIYKTEYLEGGLSKSGRALRFRCPKGMAYGSLLTMSKEFNLKIRIKESLLYIVYSKFGRKRFKEIIRCPYKLLVGVCYLPGVVLYKYWRKKYGM